jgi:hypothetical protein
MQIPCWTVCGRRNAGMERSYARAQRELERLQQSRRKRAPQTIDAPADPVPAAQPGVGLAFSPVESAPVAHPSRAEPTSEIQSPASVTLALIPLDPSSPLKPDTSHPKSAIIEKYGVPDLKS